MFEEYIAETWRCPQCGIVNKVRVKEETERIFEKDEIGIFEVSTVRVKMEVFCIKCNSECYRE